MEGVDQRDTTHQTHRSGRGGAPRRVTPARFTGGREGAWEEGGRSHQPDSPVVEGEQCREETSTSTIRYSTNINAYNIWVGWWATFETSLIRTAANIYPFVYPACIAAAIFFPFSLFLLSASRRNFWNLPTFPRIAARIFFILPVLHRPLLLSLFQHSRWSRVSTLPASCRSSLNPSSLHSCGKFPSSFPLHAGLLLSPSPLHNRRELLQSSLLDASLRGHHGRKDHCSCWFSDTVGIRLLKPRRILKQRTNGFQARHVLDCGGGSGGDILCSRS